MKDKNGTVMEDILAQLVNTRTSEFTLKSLYSKIIGNLNESCSNLSNVHRTKLLKAIKLHCTKGGYSSEIRLAALNLGIYIVKAEFSTSHNPATGATYSFVEACFEIVNESAGKPTCQHVDVVAKALEALSLVNVPTASKLFHDKGGLTFKKIVTECLKSWELKFHALALLDVSLSARESGDLTKLTSDDKLALIQLIYPLLFTLEETSLRGPALKILRRITNNRPPHWTSERLWNEMKEGTQKVYYKQMVEMVNQRQNWPEVWQFVLNMFGDELHSGGQLINHMLEVLECAFKHSDFEWTRVQAFACWETLIDNFKTGLRNKKRIALIMIPLKANNHRIESLALAKLKTYIHLFKALGKELVSSPDILLHFISFCFGSEKISCLPVRSYNALHEMGVQCLCDVIASCYIHEIFTKYQKEIIKAVGDCFTMLNVPSELLVKIWDRLLELVLNVEGTEIVKILFDTVHCLIGQANSKELSGGMMSGLSSPSRIVSTNSYLGRRLVLIVLYQMLSGKYALKSNIFTHRSLYVGSYDVMVGTPNLHVIEWLLTPVLVLSAGDSTEFKTMISKMINVQLEMFPSFMDFALSLLKKLLMFDNNVSLVKNSLLYKCAADVWCALAEEMMTYARGGGSFNQGDAAGHDFTVLFAVLMFPVQSLFVDLQLAEKCSKSWKNLFYEAYQQAALIATTSERQLFEEVCLRLISTNKSKGGAMQLATVYFYLTLMLQVALEKIHSVKRLQWVHLHISAVVKELHNTYDQEVVFKYTVSCVQLCLHPKATSSEVIANLTPTICSLLQAKIDTFDPVDKLCTLLSALKKASNLLHLHGLSKETLASILKGIIKTGKGHACQKVRSTIRELCEACDQKRTPEKEVRTFTLAGGFSPSSRSPRKLSNPSPKLLSKKIAAVQMSPSSLSPSNSKRKLQTTVCGADGKFVPIETPPKKIILTEHQKEVRRERRQDIPALYQDLSQDTQSMSQDASQDFVPLPVTPDKISQSVMPADEDAVMDVADVNASVQVLSEKVQPPKLTESVKEVKLPKELKNDGKRFTFPSGFALPSIQSNCSPRTGSSSSNNEDENLVAKQDSAPGKENEDSTPSLSKSVVSGKTARRGAMTRSSSNTDLTTRSGKILKRSLSMEPKKLKRNYVRKSLPVNSLDEQGKKDVENVSIESDTTDTESSSSVLSDPSSLSSKPVSGLTRQRRTFKKEFTLETDTCASGKKDSQSVNKAAPVLKHSSMKKDLESKSLSNDKLCGQDGNLVQNLKIGGKVLTRSRSNSSLEEVIAMNKKLKDVSTLSPSQKAPVEFQRDGEASNKSHCRSPSSPFLNLGISFGSEDSKDLSPKCSPLVEAKVSVPMPSPIQNYTDQPCDTSDLKKRPACKGPMSSPNNNKLFSEVNMEKFSRKETDSISPLSEGKEQNKHPNKARALNYECGTEESQEIIESSQEPLLHLVKPCLVSLQQFRCPNPQKITHIEDVIVEKGPDARSPFKVHSKDIRMGPAVSSVVRRSLNLDAEPVFPPAESGTTSSENSLLPLLSSIDANALLSDDPKKDELIPFEDEPKDLSKVVSNPMESESILVSVKKPDARNNSMPEWMHEKKSSSSSPVISTTRGASARRHAFLKSVSDTDASSSPPKGADVSPMCSPVQSKKFSKPLDSASSTPIIKRPSRAAQLLGLGQAAAARGGDSVIVSASRSARSIRGGEGTDENEALNINSVSSGTIPCTSSATISASSVFDSINTVTNAVVASPSIRRHSKLLDQDAVKSTPQKCLEDEGLKEDWIPKNPCASATPDSSILKRKREADVDAPSPSVKRKRVSFRDPPIESMLRFGESRESPGTVFSSDRSPGSEKISESPCGNNAEEDEVEDEVAELSSDVDSDHLRKELEKADINLLNNVCVEKSGTDSKIEDKSTEEKIQQGLTDSFPVLEDFVKRSNVSPIKENIQSPDHDKRLRAKASDQTDSLSQDKVIKNVENGLSGLEMSPHPDTQGSLDVFQQIPFNSSPLYPNLISCKHPVESIVKKLTSTVWKKSLLREFSLKEVNTIGDLAKLTEDQIDRLPVKPPKRTNVFIVLEDFEKNHGNLKDSDSCELSAVQGKVCNMDAVDIPKCSVMDVLSKASDEYILEVLTQLGRGSGFFQSVLKSKQPQDVASAVISNEKILKALPVDVVIASNEPQDVVAAVTSNERILKALPVDIVIASNEPQDVVSAVTSNERILKALPVDIVIASNEPQDVVSAVTSNERILKALPVDVVIASNEPQDVVAAVSSNKMIMKSLPVDSIIDSIAPQHIAAAVSSREEILKALPVDIVIKSNEPLDVAAVVSLNEKILSHIPVEAVLNSKQPQNIAEIVSMNQEILKSLPLDVVFKSRLPQDVANILDSNEQILKCLPINSVITSKSPQEVALALNSHQQILKALSLELVVKSNQPQDVAAVVSSDTNILKSIPIGNFVNSNKPEDIAAVISSNTDILKSLPVDVIAETYISQAHSSSGKREREMSVHELQSILCNVSKKVIVETLCPSKPNTVSCAIKSSLIDYVLQECSALQIAEHPSFDLRDACLKTFLLSKIEPNDIAELFGTEKSKRTIEALISQLNPKECLKFLIGHVDKLISSL